MNIDIPAHYKVSDILQTVQAAEEGAHIYCTNERHFSLLKICLLKLQKSELNLYLLDQHGFTIKQASSKRKPGDDTPTTEVGNQPNPSTSASSQVRSEQPTMPRVGQEHVVQPTTISPPVAQPVEQGMSNQQISAVRDLEQNLRRCKELGLLLVGFSDGLVAVPEALGFGTDAISSADALEVESFEAYRGYEADELN